MPRTHPRFVPSSIQRLRSALSGHGLRAKPWASVEETLDACYDLLADHRTDEGFWQGLETLLAVLTRDLRTRMKAPRSEVIENELLDETRLGALLAEIRRKVETGRGEKGRFAGFARRLSARAAGLALVLGGAITAGCYTSTGLRGDVQETRDGVEEPDSDPAPDFRPDPDVPLPDLLPDPVPDPPCDPAGRTLDEILASCVSTVEMQEYYRECIDAMHASWRAGLTELFACESCGQVREQLMNCLEWRCEYIDPDEAFDLEAFLDDCGVPIYIGVRF